MKFSFLIVALFVYSFGHAQDSDASKNANIIHIISLFKQKNIDEISTVINYPLKRENPIPSIKKPKDFKQRFYEVFDQKLVDLIAHSKPDQWTEVGWRGIMLDNGKLWIDSEAGKITAVNYQSPFEKKLRQTLIQKQKEYIHHSLKQFKTPVYTIRSEKYLIRIDELANGKYRYASWKHRKKRKHVT